MEKRNISIEQIGTQFILIVFSVVLGLYLSERIEEGKKRQESEGLLTTIKSEAKDNLALLREWLPYHQEMKIKLDSLSKDEGFIEGFIDNKYLFFEILLTKGTFMSRRPTSDAWDIAKSHPLIVNIDYDKWVILSRIYNQQELTFEPALEMIELLESKDVNLKEDAKSNLELISNRMHEFVAREEQLMYYYKKAEKILELDGSWEVEH